MVMGNRRVNCPVSDLVLVIGVSVPYPYPKPSLFHSLIKK